MQKTTDVWNLPAPLSRAMTMCLCALALSSCAEWPDSGPIDAQKVEIINIEFELVGNVLCPKEQADVCTNANNVNILTVEKSTRIGWQSVDTNGNPIETEYAIWLDPFGRFFKGPLKSNSKGEIKPLKLDTRAPPQKPFKDGIIYKYTIVGKGCEDRPVDPRFRVR